MRPGEPFVAQPGDLDGEPAAVESHRAYHARALDAGERVGGAFRCRHREAQEEVMVLGHRLDRLLDALAILFRYAEQRGIELAGKEQRRRSVPAVKVVAHVQRVHHDRL